MSVCPPAPTNAGKIIAPSTDAQGGPEWTDPAYLASLSDAADMPPWPRLTALVPKAPLSFRGQGQDIEFLFVTWTDRPDKAGFEPQTVKNFWVTAAPLLQSFCRSFPQGIDVTRRLEQALGLPPHRGYTHFVEFWAHGTEILRPCADAETDDTICNGKGVGPDIYQEAMDGREKCKKPGPFCFPFTGRGYTYDWGDNPSHVGFTEFVVPKNKRTTFERAAPTDVYCAPRSSSP